MDNRILVFGDAVAEVSVRVDSLPEVGGDASATEPELTMGGSAANTAVAAAAAGADVTMLANVGNDSFSIQIINGLSGVDTSLVHRVPGPSPLVIVLVSPSGEKTMISARGPAAESSPIPSRLTEFRHLHLSGYSFQDAGSAGTASALRGIAAEEGWSTSLTGSAQFDQVDQLIGFDYLFVNAAEASMLSGLDDLERAGRVLRERVPNVVITQGADGCTIFMEGSSTPLDAVPVDNIVDTTGAGDALAGATLADIVGGEELVEAVRSGLSAAAQALTYRGGH